MKILLINNFHYYKGGSEAVYFNTADILRKHGHEVLFFSFDRKENISCEQSPYFVTENANLPKWKSLFNYFYNTEAKRKLSELIKDEKPDIAHIHLFWGGISPSILSTLRKNNIPIIHTAHDYRIVCPAYSFKDSFGNTCEACQGKYFYKCTLKRCSKGSLAQSLIMSLEMYFRNVFFNPAKKLNGIIFVSNFSKSKHMQYAPKLANIESLVLYNYSSKVDINVMSSKHKEYILFMGRLSYEKGIQTLIKAFEQIIDIPLKIAGTGPEEDEIKKYIKQKGLTNIELLGYKSGNNLKQLVSKALFVIVPSECYENNPMTIVEANSSGVPVIGSNTGGIPEIIEDRKSGFLFTPRSVEELASVVRYAQNISEIEYKHMSENALIVAKKKFNEENHYERLISFYDQIIKSKYQQHLTSLTLL